jgi:hypothetical protein
MSNKEAAAVKPFMNPEYWQSDFILYLSQG